jgi:hypothetical protein
MKSQKCFLVAALLLMVIRPVVSEGPATKLRPDQVEEIRTYVSHLKAIYRDHEMPRNSSDHAKFDRIAVAALFDPQFIDDLIDLTSVRYMSKETRGITPPSYTFSPAASELLMLGEASRRPIEMRLAGSTLTERQRGVLKDVLNGLDKIRGDSNAFRGQEQREAVIARMEKEGTLGGWVELATNPTPDSETPEPVIPTSAPASDSPLRSASHWLVWGAVIIAGIVVFRLMYTSRKLRE